MENRVDYEAHKEDLWYYNNNNDNYTNKTNKNNNILVAKEKNKKKHAGQFHVVVAPNLWSIDTASP